MQQGKLTGFNAGVDGKIGITNNMIIDFTLNPDFGQVEADPSQVNLTHMKYFSKKKDLFLLKARIYLIPLCFFMVVITSNLRISSIPVVLDAIHSQVPILRR